MTTFKKTCTKESTDKILTLEENKRKCVFQNPDRCLLTKVTVDGCQITDGAKCDYLVLDHYQYQTELISKNIILQTAIKK